MTCNFPSSLVIELSFSLASRLTRDYSPRSHRRHVADECRSMLRGVPGDERRYVVGYLREGVRVAREVRNIRWLPSPTFPPVGDVKTRRDAVKPTAI